nr:hypothetical protein [Tanacetum cinerariifolium]
MSGSEPGEMASESSRAVVLPKFDMHIYTSRLTSSKLKAAIEEYCIPLDLHPRLPHPGMMMNRLPSKYIGLYIEQLEQGGLRIPFSSFFLAVIRHFGVHFSQLVLMGVNRVILFEVRCASLKINPFVSVFWVFYKLCKQDRHEIPDAMPWRHDDADLHDDFPINYSESNAARLSKVLVPLRPPPRHLLYVCGLTTACRHPELRYDIKDQDKNGNSRVISIDTFLKLPSWTGTVVSKGDPIPDDQRPNPRVTPPLEAGAKIPELTVFQKNLENPNPKIAAARERKERQNLTKAKAKCDGAKANEGQKKKRKVQKHHVSIQSCSKGTLSVTPLHQAKPAVAKKSTLPVDAVADASHIENEVLNLIGNTRVLTPSAATTQPSTHTEQPNTQEHAASDEDEFLGSLSNAEIVNHAYQNLRQSVLAQGELLKRHEQLSHDYVDLVNCSDANLEELDRLRLSLQRANQDNKGLANKLSLLDSVHSECPSQEKELLDRVKDLERERDEWRVTALSQVADSYDLPMTELLKVSLDVPSSANKGATAGVVTEEAPQQPSPTAPKITSDTPSAPPLDSLCSLFPCMLKNLFSFVTMNSDGTSAILYANHIE